MTNDDRKNLVRLINRYTQAAVDHAFKGASHPDDWPQIEKRIETAWRKLHEALDQLQAKIPPEVLRKDRRSDARSTRKAKG